MNSQSWLLSLPGVILQWLKLGVLDITGELRRAADRTMEDLQEASRDVGVMEWFWLAVLVLLALASWYWMLLSAGQQQGFW